MSRKGNKNKHLSDLMIPERSSSWQSSSLLTANDETKSRTVNDFGDDKEGGSSFPVEQRTTEYALKKADVYKSLDAGGFESKDGSGRGGIEEHNEDYNDSDDPDDDDFDDGTRHYAEGDENNVDDEDDYSVPIKRESRKSVIRNHIVMPGQINVENGLEKKNANKRYLRELARLQEELVKLQAWILHKKLKVVVLFEGRDAAGKGGVIKRITEKLNPRICRVVALGTPTEREKTQWYFQRYVSCLPAAGEMVLFDRSWYNRAGVEKVMNFCTAEEHQEFMYSCPIFEEMIIRSGILLIKYWFSVSDDVQEKRFQGRIEEPTKRWKLSPMDIESRNRWVEYSKAKDEMLRNTDTDKAPWIHVHADSKKLARLNCISHLLSLIPYQDLTPQRGILPPRKHCQDYVRPPLTSMKWVPDKFM